LPILSVVRDNFNIAVCDRYLFVLEEKEVDEELVDDAVEEACSASDGNAACIWAMLWKPSYTFPFMTSAGKTDGM